MTHLTRLDGIFGGPLLRLVKEPDEGEIDPGIITGDRLADVSIHRAGREAPLAQQSAGTCQLTIAGGLGVDVGGPLDTAHGFTIELDPAAQLAVFGAEIPGATRFVGRVTDLGDVEASTHARATARIPVTAASLLARLDNTALTVSWPDGTDDITILTGLLTQLWTDDAGLRVGPWRDDVMPWISRLAGRPPVESGYRFDAWDPAGQSASSVIALTGATTLGVLIERADGAIDYLRPTERAGPAEGGGSLHDPVDIPTSAILDPIMVGKRIGDVINVATVSYGAGDVTVTATDALSVARFGRLAARHDTRLGIGEGELGLEAARQVAQRIVGHFGSPAWRVAVLTVDVLALIEAGELTLAKAVIALECETAIRITGALPATAPDVPADYIITGIDETITAASWRITFSVVDRWLIDTVQWGDYPAALTWADIPPTIDWTAATRWMPAS